VGWAILAGIATVELGRVTYEGLRHSKRSFSTVSKPLPYYYYSRVAGVVSTYERSRAYQVLTDLWRRLPLPVAERLGGSIYPHMA
jgi:hypothetical protein